MDLVQAVGSDEPKKDYSVKIINPRNSLNPFQRKVQLGKDRKGELEESLYRQFTDWNSGISIFRSRLQRWVNNSEGVSEPRNLENLVWPRASQIFKPLTETRLNIVHSFFMGVVRQRMGRLFQVVYEDKWNEQKVRLCTDLSHFFNCQYDFNLMYVMGVDEAFWAVGRDGTIGRTINWDKRVERRWETVKYTDLGVFVEKFPTPADANLTTEEYTGIVSQLQIGEAVWLDEDYDDTTFDGPVIDFSEIKDVVWFPVNAKSQAQMIFIGEVIWERESDMRIKQRDGVYSGVEEVVKNSPQEDDDAVTNQQDAIEGISSGSKKNFYRSIHGRYLADLDGDGIEEKYLITYNIDSKKFLQFDRFPFFHNRDHIQITGFKKRPKRLLYRGISEMLEDLQEEANIAARQRIDSRSITNSPQFKAVDSLKSVLDPMRPENRFRPGGIWWLPQMFFDKVAPVEVAKRDFGDSLNEEANFDRSADNIMGASELRSGRETPMDPRAPAAKTAMLLSQSASRLDDFIYNFILGENRVLDIALKLYAQYGPDKLTFYVEELEKIEGRLKAGYAKKVIESSILRDPKIHLQLSFTSLLDNPEYLKALWEEFYAKYNAEPMLGAIPEVRHKILDGIVTNTPEIAGKNLLPPLEQILSQMPVDPMTGQPMMTPPPTQNPPNNPTLQSAMKGAPSIGG